MSYEVIARKWRPQAFEEVVGQDHVVRTLRSAIEKGRIAQAYLFAGPRGTGKTTLSRIFEKALNCVHGPTVHPCGQCPACRAIMSGSSFDVVEIDGASNNKVEDVQERIISQVQNAPVEGKFRVFYIDEVHMLSTAAFNALLKTLEEPPPYLKFIFATTEPDKVLGTILSRCQRFDLRRISQTDICGQLRKICDAETIVATELEHRSIPEGIRHVFSEKLVFNDTARRWFVTVGQFSIIRLERDTQLVVPAYDYCLPEKESPVTVTDDPCTLFSRIHFPVEEFFPPDSISESEDYRSLK